MVLLEQGLNIFRDEIHDAIIDGQLGSDGTEVTEADVGLGTPISGTTKTLIKTKFNKGIKLSYSTSAGDGDGSSAREWVALNGVGVAVLRVSNPQIDIGPSTQIDIDSQIIILQQL